MASHVSVGDTSHRLFKHGLKTGLSPKRLMRSGWLRLLQTHNRGLIFHCTAARQSQKYSHAYTHTRTNTHICWISCRHHKPAASLTEFSFPITSSDDLITFPFDAAHKNKRTIDGISLLSIRVCVCVSLSFLSDN